MFGVELFDECPGGKCIKLRYCLAHKEPVSTCPLRRAGQKIKTALTLKQKEILSFINVYIKENGYPPTIKEIGENVGLSSKSSVFNQLMKIEDKGYIQVGRSMARAIKILKMPA